MSGSTLDTGIRQVKNVGSFKFGAGSIDELPEYLDSRRAQAAASRRETPVIYFVDEFFADNTSIIARLGQKPGDRLEIVTTATEPKTEGIDQRVAALVHAGFQEPSTLVALGGGCTLDTTKAVANLLTNGGLAEQYQGWDLVKRPAVHKVAIPTISGTGAEATRTCVMTNSRTGLKLGMNSDHTVFDHVILDPDLTATVPRNQYFFTGMDAYIHCIESTSGSFRNAIGDAYSRETISLCRRVFLADDMMSPESREQLMVASYLGGCAIATSYVGVVHPLSAGLSVVLGLHHCVANCIVMRAMGEFYPEAHDEFFAMAERQHVTIPEGVCRGLSDEQYHSLYKATLIHDKPLTNALGSGYRDVLTFDKVVRLFESM
ncbi:MAG: iron-containing alcohol dehydrogenase family protein [Gemmatimonadota bacterium]|nr:iron-containing alcohol dehydrogenase family protein [Gemmatimonadota bacterium]